MRIVTGRATFPHGLMFENKRPTLRSVAIAAGVVLGQQRGAATPNRRTFMRIMTIAATHLPIDHGMAVCQLKLSSFVQVTLEADVRGSFGIDDCVMGAAALIVDAAGAVTRFAADLLRVGSFGLQSRVRCGLEIAHDVGMTFGAALRADKFGAGNRGRNDNGPGEGRAGNEAHGRECRAQKKQDEPATPEKTQNASS
jgi:hypothetical protein